MRLMDKRPTWIWQRDDWPDFRFDAEQTAPYLAEVYRLHGVIEGKASAIGLRATTEIALDALAHEVLATSQIEGVQLAVDAVRSSVMRKLGLAEIGPVDRNVDALVDVISDAATSYEKPLDHERLWQWQAALFPDGRSGGHRIAVGRYRDHEEPMQIIGGKLGREVVHYEAPPSKDVHEHMSRFLKWFDETSPAKTAPGARVDGFARAAIAHFWFEAIHPFEDGNGRVGRAVADMAVAQHLRQPTRLYSMSQQLLTSRGDYYAALNKASRGDMDLTPWVQWFAKECGAACQRAAKVIDGAMEKRRFWDSHAGTKLEERQRKVLQRLLDCGDGGFEGGLNAEKYMKLTHVSNSTAKRDLAEMVAQGQLWTHGAGKAIRYYINVPGWSHGIEHPALDAGKAEQSEQDLRTALDEAGYAVTELSGGHDRQYFGPIVATGAMHVAQDVGRRQAVIHAFHALDVVPVKGDRVVITFKGGKGMVAGMDGPGREVGR
jgi:Fic family protein